jgi:hypothetical protein
MVIHPSLNELTAWRSKSWTKTDRIAQIENNAKNAPRQRIVAEGRSIDRQSSEFANLPNWP